MGKDIAVWGPTSAGKTVLWAMLKIDQDQRPSKDRFVITDIGESNIILEIRSRLKLKREFPPGTDLNIGETLGYLVRRKLRNAPFRKKIKYIRSLEKKIDFCDISGKWFSEKDDAKRKAKQAYDEKESEYEKEKNEKEKKRLKEELDAFIKDIDVYLLTSKGCIFILDMTADEYTFEGNLKDLVLKLNQMRRTENTQLLSFPVIFCISKADILFCDKNKPENISDSELEKLMTGVLPLEQFKENRLVTSNTKLRDFVTQIENYFADTSTVLCCFLSAIGYLKFNNTYYPNVMRDQRGRYRVIFHEDKNGVNVNRLNVMDVLEKMTDMIR